MRLLAFFSIQALLSAPNPDDPLSENIAKHWKSNEAEAVETGIFLWFIKEFADNDGINSYYFHVLIKMWHWNLQRRNGPDYMLVTPDDKVQSMAP